IDIKALKNCINVIAKLDIKVEANKISITAKEEVLINGGTSYTRWNASGIESGTKGLWREHASQHSLVGPNSLGSPTLPETMKLGKGQLDLFNHYLKPDGDKRQGVKQGEYTVTDAEGGVHKGSLDAQGFASVAGLPIGTAKVVFGKDPRSSWEEASHFPDSEKWAGDLGGSGLPLNPPASFVAAPKGGGGSPSSKLGTGVDEFVAKSPTLQKDLEKLKSAGWSIDYGEVGKGSYADRAAKIINLDGALVDDPARATQILAHETGHALYPYKENLSSKAAYVNGCLADEGAATLNNIKVQREIIANGGEDIGIAGDSKNHAAYNGAYDKFLGDKNKQAAINSIGKIFGNNEITSTTNQPYADYYGSYYPGKSRGKK
ncbi:DUF2345 domain-containing protein, partial [Variovorax rhizosphaerae]